MEIIVVGDTHASSFNKLPMEMLLAIKKADFVIHAGDYTSKEVFDGFKKIKKHKFKGVYGNADPQSIRNETLEKDLLEIKNKKIGIIHPAIGGPENLTKRRSVAAFKKDFVDAIIYGHTHNAGIELYKGVLLINPGKGYLEKNYPGSPTTFAVLTISNKIKGIIQRIN